MFSSHVLSSQSSPLTLTGPTWAGTASIVMRGGDQINEIKEEKGVFVVTAALHINQLNKLMSLVMTVWYEQLLTRASLCFGKMVGTWLKKSFKLSSSEGMTLLAELNVMSQPYLCAAFIHRNFISHWRSYAATWDYLDNTYNMCFAAARDQAPNNTWWKLLIGAWQFGGYFS